MYVKPMYQWHVYHQCDSGLPHRQPMRCGRGNQWSWLPIMFTLYLEAHMDRSAEWHGMRRRGCMYTDGSMFQRDLYRHKHHM